MGAWIIENDSSCKKNPKPTNITKQMCNEIMCPPSYVPSSWSKVTLIDINSRFSDNFVKNQLS